MSYSWLEGLCCTVADRFEIISQKVDGFFVSPLKKYNEGSFFCVDIHQFFWLLDRDFFVGVSVSSVPSS